MAAHDHSTPGTASHRTAGGDDGIVRECTCPVANHQHGTRVAYVVDKCRCRPCRDASSAAERHRLRMKAYGRWEPYVDAEPARAHVRALQAAGMGWKRIADRAGIQRSTMWRLLYGSNGQPSARIRRETLEKVLAVTVDLADATIVDATGTRRRLQALVAIGWTQTRLAAELGCHPGNINPLVLGTRCPRVQHDTTVRVAALYDRLWDQEPPVTNNHQRAGIARAKAVAAQHGWAPPIAWDDDTIDDPAAEPFTGAPSGTGRGARTADTVEDVEFLLSTNPYTTSWVIAERLGYADQSGVQAALKRAGRTDLLDQLARNAALERKAA